MHNSYHALSYEASDGLSDQVAASEEWGSRTANVLDVGRISLNVSTGGEKVTKSKSKKVRRGTPVRSNDDFPARSNLPASKSSEGVIPIVNQVTPTNTCSFSNNSLSNDAEGFSSFGFDDSMSEHDVRDILFEAGYSLEAINDIIATKAKVKINDPSS